MKVLPSGSILVSAADYPDVLDDCERVDLADLGSVVAIDTETTGLCVDLEDRPFMVGLMDEDGRYWSCVWEVDPMTRRVRVNPDDVRALNFFFRGSRRYVFHHGKFDVRMLAAVGVRVPEGSWDDTLVAAKCVKTDELGFGLKPLAKRYLKIYSDDETALKDEVKRQRREGRKLGWKLADDVEADYWLAPDLAETYMLCDCARTSGLWMLYRELIDEEGVRATYDREMLLQPTVCRMEDRGAQVDRSALKIANKKTDERMRAARDDLDRYFGKEFNPNSPKQKQEALFTEKKKGGLGYTPTKFTKTKQPSTDRDALESLNCLEAEAIITWTKQDKMRQFYSTWDRLMTRDGILHPHLEPQAARTGRFGCREPNLQQVPKRSAEAKEARACFVPRAGYVWWALDYSQMELRLLAGLAGEEAMLAAYRNGRDIHEETGTRVFPDYHSNVDLWRTRAKNINFGIIYGMGPAKLARELGITFEEAAEFLSNYHAAFPSVREFMDEMISQAQREGFIINPFGRRINVSPLDAYKATNYMIQSSGADMIKRAMPTVERYLLDLGIDARMILQVHDELIIEVAEHDAHLSIVKGIRNILEDHGGHLPIDLPVDTAWVSSGSSWAGKMELTRDYRVAA